MTETNNQTTIVQDPVTGLPVEQQVQAQSTDNASTEETAVWAKDDTLPQHPANGTLAQDDMVAPQASLAEQGDNQLTQYQPLKSNGFDPVTGLPLVEEPATEDGTVEDLMAYREWGQNGGGEDGNATSIANDLVEKSSISASRPTANKRKVKYDFSSLETTKMPDELSKLKASIALINDPDVKNAEVERYNAMVNEYNHRITIENATYKAITKNKTIAKFSEREYNEATNKYPEVYDDAIYRCNGLSTAQVKEQALKVATTSTRDTMQQAAILAGLSAVLNARETGTIPKKIMDYAIDAARENGILAPLTEESMRKWMGSADGYNSRDVKQTPVYKAAKRALELFYEAEGTTREKVLANAANAEKAIARGSMGANLMPGSTYEDAPMMLDMMTESKGLIAEGTNLTKYLRQAFNEMDASWRDGYFFAMSHDKYMTPSEAEQYTYNLTKQLTMHWLAQDKVPVDNAEYFLRTVVNSLYPVEIANLGARIASGISYADTKEDIKAKIKGNGLSHYIPESGVTAMDIDDMAMEMYRDQHKSAWDTTVQILAPVTAFMINSTVDGTFVVPNAVGKGVTKGSGWLFRQFMPRLSKLTSSVSERVLKDDMMYQLSTRALGGAAMFSYMDARSAAFQGAQRAGGFDWKQTIKSGAKGLPKGLLFSFANTGVGYLTENWTKVAAIAGEGIKIGTETMVFAGFDCLDLPKGKNMSAHEWGSALGLTLATRFTKGKAYINEVRSRVRGDQVKYGLSMKPISAEGARKLELAGFPEMANLLRGNISEAEDRMSALEKEYEKLKENKTLPLEYLRRAEFALNATPTPTPGTCYIEPTDNGDGTYSIIRKTFDGRQINAVPETVSGKELENAEHEARMARAGVYIVNADMNAAKAAINQACANLSTTMMPTEGKEWTPEKVQAEYRMLVAKKDKGEKLSTQEQKLLDNVDKELESIKAFSLSGTTIARVEREYGVKVKKLLKKNPNKLTKEEKKVLRILEGALCHVATIDVDNAVKPIDAENAESVANDAVKEAEDTLKEEEKLNEGEITTNNPAPDVVPEPAVEPEPVVEPEPKKDDGIKDKAEDVPAEEPVDENVVRSIVGSMTAVEMADKYEQIMSLPNPTPLERATAGAIDEYFENHERPAKDRMHADKSLEELARMEKEDGDDEDGNIAKEFMFRGYHKDFNQNAWVNGKGNVVKAPEPTVGDLVSKHETLAEKAREIEGKIANIKGNSKEKNQLKREAEELYKQIDALENEINDKDGYDLYVPFAPSRPVKVPAGAHPVEIEFAQAEQAFAKNKEAMDVLHDEEPKTPWEYISLCFSKGSLLWGNKGVVKGAQTHTGMKWADVAGLRFLFSKDGVGLEKFAEQIYADMPDHLRHNIDDTDVLNMVIEMLRECKSSGDIKNIIKANRIEAARAIFERNGLSEEEIERRKIERAEQEAFEAERREEDEAVYEGAKESLDALSDEEYENLSVPEQYEEGTDVNNKNNENETRGNQTGDSVLAQSQGDNAERGEGAPEPQRTEGEENGAGTETLKEGEGPSLDRGEDGEEPGELDGRVGRESYFNPGVINKDKRFEPLEQSHGKITSAQLNEVEIDDAGNVVAKVTVTFEDGKKRTLKDVSLQQVPGDSIVPNNAERSRGNTIARLVNVISNPGTSEAQKRSARATLAALNVPLEAPKKTEAQVAAEKMSEEELSTKYNELAERVSKGEELSQEERDLVKEMDKLLESKDEKYSRRKKKSKKEKKKTKTPAKVVADKKEEEIQKAVEEEFSEKVKGETVSFDELKRRWEKDYDTVSRKKENLSKTTNKLVDLLNKRLGYTVKILPKVFGSEKGKTFEVNGKIDPESKTIYLSQSAQTGATMRWIYGHEVGHELDDQDTEAFDMFKGLVKEFMGRRFVDEVAEEMVNAGAESFSKEEYAAAETEVVCNHIGDVLNNIDFAQRIVKALDPERRSSVIFRLIDKMSDLKQKLKVEWNTRKLNEDGEELRLLYNIQQNLRGMLLNAHESTNSREEQNSRKGNDLYRDKEEYKEGQVLTIEDGFDGYTVEGMTMPYKNTENLLEAWRTKHPDYNAFLTDNGKGIEVYPIEGGKTRLEALLGNARSSKQRQQYAERKARMMHDTAIKVGKELGVKVNIIEPGTETDADRINSKGWYDAGTDEVNVVLGNHVDDWDVRATVLREAVVNHGLRKVVGKAEFNDWLYDIYSRVGYDAQQKIDDIANKQGITHAEATEEYMASLAEDMSFSDHMPTWWRRVSDFLKDKIGGVLDKDNIKPKFTLGNDEMRYLLWSSYNRLRRDAGNSIVSDAEMRENLGIGNYAVADSGEKYSRIREEKKERLESLSEAVKSNLKQEFGSAGTSLNQVARAFRVIGERGDWKEGTTNVDIGGGRFDKASEYLKDTYGVENLVFDPFNRDAESNRKIAEMVRDNKVDTVTCNNVLNVIKEKESRANVILQAAKAIKEDGTAYFSVYEGNKSGEGKQSKDDCWQNNRPTKDYVSEVEEYFEDVALKNGVITAKSPKATDELSVWATDASYEDVVKFSRKKHDFKNPVKYNDKQTEECIGEIVEQMKNNAETLRYITYTEDTYKAEFPDGKAETPIGIVRVANLVKKKFSTYDKGERANRFGMTAPTLKRPDIIVERYSPEKGAERQTKYLFVKSFLDENKNKVYNFESVTVSKEGEEVAISSHDIDLSAVKKVLREGNLLWIRFGGESDSSDKNQGLDNHQANKSELEENGPIPQRKFSADKVKDNSTTVQETGRKNSRKRDAEYKAAVESGDVETYTRMLEEEAKAKGYSSDSEYQGKSAFNGSAPSAHEYYETPEESLKAWENEEYEGSWSVADEFVRGIKMGNLANRITAGDYARGNQFQRESIQALREAMAKVQKGNNNPTVKVYRSVPKGVKEGSFRNGDWVTLSKSYAKDNAEIHAGMTYNGRDGMAGWKDKGYNIIEMDVPIEDLWWDGNDINEFGYDNGKSYVYKNTKNGRKLFDPTYDDDGNLIPLSERFSQRKQDERYSRKRLDENEQTRKEYRERAIKEAQDILNDDARYAREKRDQIKNLLDDVVRRPAYSGKMLQVLSLRTQLEDAEKYLDQAEKAAMVMTDTEPRSAVREWNNGGLYTKAEMAIQKVEAELHMRDILNGLVGDTEDYTELRDDINSLLRQINTVNRSRSKNKNEALIQLNAALAEKQEQMRELLKDLTPEQRANLKREELRVEIATARLNQLDDMPPEIPAGGERLFSEATGEDFTPPSEIDYAADDSMIDYSLDPSDPVRIRQEQMYEAEVERLQQKFRDDRNEWFEKFGEFKEQWEEYDAALQDWKKRQREYAKTISDAENKLSVDADLVDWNNKSKRGAGSAMEHLQNGGVDMSLSDVASLLRNLRYERRRVIEHSAGEDNLVISGLRIALRKILNTDLRNKLGGFHGYNSASAKKAEKELIDMVQGTLSTPAELRNIVRGINDWFEDMFNWQLANGMTDFTKHRKNYVPQIWDMEKSKPDEEAQKRLGASGLSAASTESAFMQQRIFETYEEGIEHGMVPKYNSIFDLMQVYGHQVSTAVANRQYLNAAKKLRIETEIPSVDEEGNPTYDVVYKPILATAGDANYGNKLYKAIENTAFYKDGMPHLFVLRPDENTGLITNEIAATLGDGGPTNKALMAFDKLSNVIKGSMLKLSLFHHIALTEHNLGLYGLNRGGVAHSAWNIMVDNLLKTLWTGQSTAERNPELAMEARTHFVKLGGSVEYDKAASDFANVANRVLGNIENKLWQRFADAKDSIEREAAAKDILKLLGSALGIETTNMVKLPVAILAKINQLGDHFLWDVVHDGYKLHAYSELKRRVMNQAKKNGWDETRINKELDECGQRVNDMYGGQHWDLLKFSPKVMRGLRRMFLSPDWNVSWMRLLLGTTGMGKLYNEASGNMASRFVAGRRFLKTDEDGKFKWVEDAGKTAQKATALVSALSMFRVTVAYTLLNYLFRKQDEEEQLEEAKKRKEGFVDEYGTQHLPDPDYKTPNERAGIKPDNWKEEPLETLNKYLLSPWNTMNDPGKGTYMFAGRNKDGRSKYVRFGKQMREVYALGFNEFDEFDPIGAIGHEFFNKSNPAIGTVYHAVTGRSLNGWEDKEMANKYGLDLQMQRLKVLAMSFLPMSVSGDKEVDGWNFFMPTSKGFSKYSAKKRLERAYLRGDTDEVERIKRACALNGINWESIDKQAKGSADLANEEPITKGLDTPEAVLNKMDSVHDLKEKTKLENKYKEMTESYDQRVDDVVDKAKEAYRNTAKLSERYKQYRTGADFEEDIAVHKLDKQITESGVVKKFNDLGGKIEPSRNSFLVNNKESKEFFEAHKIELRIVMRVRYWNTRQTKLSQRLNGNSLNDKAVWATIRSERKQVLKDIQDIINGKDPFWVGKSTRKEKKKKKE